MHQQRGWSSVAGWSGAVLLAAAFLVFVGRATSQPDGKPAVPTVQAPAPDFDYQAHPDLTMERIRKISIATHGDWNSVSEVDQHLMNSLTDGHGRSMFKMMAEKQKTDSKASSKRQRKDRQ